MKTKRINLRLTKDEYEALIRASELTGLSMSAIICKCLELHLDELTDGINALEQILHNGCTPDIFTDSDDNEPIPF